MATDHRTLDEYLSDAGLDPETLTADEKANIAFSQIRELEDRVAGLEAISMATDAPILRVGAVRFEITEHDRDEERFRARLVGAGYWGGGDTVREAIRSAASVSTDDELHGAFGELWESGV